MYAKDCNLAAKLLDLTKAIRYFSLPTASIALHVYHIAGEDSSFNKAVGNAGCFCI